jgi:hypothetical protein
VYRRLHPATPYVCFAWLLALLGPLLWHNAGLRPETWPPEVPNVLRPPALYGTPTDVVTPIGYLLWIVMFAIACCIPLEIAKYKTRQVRAFVALTALEMILALDLLRAYAWAWWSFLLGVAGIVPMDELSGARISLTKSGAWPWVSGLGALATLYVLHREGPWTTRASEEDQRVIGEERHPTSD